jgi:hypothetical protein
MAVDRFSEELERPASNCVEIGLCEPWPPPPSRPFTFHLGVLARRFLLMAANLRAAWRLAKCVTSLMLQLSHDLTKASA